MLLIIYETILKTLNIKKINIHANKTWNHLRPQENRSRMKSKLLGNGRANVFHIFSLVFALMFLDNDATHRPQTPHTGSSNYHNYYSLKMYFDKPRTHMLSQAIHDKQMNAHSSSTFLQTSHNGVSLRQLLLNFFRDQKVWKQNL